MLAEPLHVLDGTPVSRIELIPPVHQRVYRMGLEAPSGLLSSARRSTSFCAAASGCADWVAVPERAYIEPVYVLFEDFTHVKFYRCSFFDVVEDEVGVLEGLPRMMPPTGRPQRPATATGPNPLPR